MTLGNELGEAGYCPRQIDTTATVTMEDSAAGWTMTQVHGCDCHGAKGGAVRLY